MQRGSDATVPLQASSTPPTSVDRIEAPQPEPLPTEESLPQLDAPSAPPAPQPAPARRQRTPAPAPIPVEAPVQLVENDQPSVDTIAQAKDDLMLALALVADAQSRAGSTVSTEIGRAAGALSESSVF
ncbi:MAG: hypothetical protein Rubg2KO_16120 [Rubricoccaceae bacterium]